MIERNGERRSGISVQAARHDDDEIQFNISTESISKTLQFQTIQFSISMQFKFQNSSILNNSV